jgi:hypothetical protein
MHGWYVEYKLHRLCQNSPHLFDESLKSNASVSQQRKNEHKEGCVSLYRREVMEEVKLDLVPILEDWSLFGTDILMTKWVSREEIEQMYLTEPKPISTET